LLHFQHLDFGQLDIDRIIMKSEILMKKINFGKILKKNKIIVDKNSNVGYYKYDYDDKTAFRNTHIIISVVMLIIALIIFNYNKILTI
jgi:hypothetical protein